MDNKNSKEVEVKIDVEEVLAEAQELNHSEDTEVVEVKDEKADTAKPKSDKHSASSVPAAANAVVSGGTTDEVVLSKCVYKNAFARKSLTVHHVQRRLMELGFKVVDSDKDGWYGDMTKLAVSQFQAANGIECDGLMDSVTLTELFAGDHNVTVVLA